MTTTPRAPGTARDPPRGSGLAWGGPARRPAPVARATLLTAMLGGAALLAHAVPQSYAIDPEQTHIHWELRHFGTSTSRGRFDDISGNITLDREARRGDASITIATGSVSTGFGPYDGVVRGPYVLSTTAYPKAYFVSNRFVFEGDRLTAVEGVLTLRDIGRALTLRALRFSCRTDTEPAREVCGGDFEAEFPRSAYEVTHSLPFVADKVRVVIQIEAARR